MPRIFLLISCVFFYTTAGFGQEAGKPFPINAPAVLGAWDTYLKDQDCKGQSLTDLLGMMDTRMAVIKGDLIVDQLEGSSQGLEGARDQAAGYNAIAQEALDKGCADTAKKIFLSVIDTFQGSEYEAARQRASIGIDDARAAE